MKNLLVVVFVFLFIACNKDSSPIKSPNNEPALYGTWQEIHTTRYDLDDQIIEQVSLDTLRITKRSYFDTHLQGLGIHLSQEQFKYIVHDTYEFASDSLYITPDSLTDVTGAIHYWDSNSGRFEPEFPVRTYPFTSFIRFVDNDNYIETRQFPDCRLEIKCRRIAENPIDLNPELESYRSQLLKPANKTYDNIRAMQEDPE